MTFTFCLHSWMEGVFQRPEGYVSQKTRTGELALQEERQEPCAQQQEQEVEIPQGHSVRKDFECLTGFKL